MKVLLLLLLLSSYAYADNQSTRDIFVPFCGIPQQMDDTTTNQRLTDSNAGRMYCYAFTPCVGIDAATQINLRTGTASITTGTYHIGVAIYDVNGNPVVRGKDTYTEASGSSMLTFSGSELTIPGGGSTFTITAGHIYYSCHCGYETSGGASYWTEGNVSTRLPHYMNAFGTGYWGYSSGTCDSTALPPSTMGSLTAVTLAYPAILHIATATP